MDTRGKIVEWAKLMGFQGKIPETFYSVCNASTAPIWAQIVTQVIPRQETRHIRQNLIIQDLKQSAIKTKVDHGLNFLQQVSTKEVKVWREKFRLQKALDGAEKNLRTKEKELEDISYQNRALYIKIENIKQRIKEFEGKEYLYRKRAKKIEEEVAEAERRFEKWASLTSGANSKDIASITGDINKCAAILNACISSLKDDQCCNISPSLVYSSILSTPGLCITNTPGLYITNNSQRFDYSICGTGRIDAVLETELMRIGDSVHNDFILKLLHSYDQRVLWSVMKNIPENLQVEFRAFVMNNEDKPFEISNNETKHYFANLHAMHIEKELDTLLRSQQVKRLQRQISDRNIEIEDLLMSNYSSKTRVFEIKSTIQSNQKEVAMSAKLNSLIEGLNQLKAKRAQTNQTDRYKQESLQLQELIVSNVKRFNYKLKLFSTARQLILTKMDEATNLTRELILMIDDVNWLSPLTKRLASEEVETFSNICLDYNRRFVYTCSSKNKFLRDVSTHTLPYIENLDSSTISILATIVQSPSSFPEAVLLNIRRKKRRLEILRSLDGFPTTIGPKRYSLEQLQNQDAQVNKATEKLRCVLQKINSSHFKNSATKIQERMVIWRDMPFKDHLSPLYLVDGHNYKYWEELYDLHYKKL